ncbi:MAG: PfkB family carbohydrate kinase [Planctomycetaceae bacterium]|nr:PfkB family carbohydrate kinase [Planctomycetaceae bacterium]
MSLLVVGSLAIDTIETPQDRRENVLGGSATHFAHAACFFSPVQLVGVVGEDWPEEYTRFFENRNIDMTGMEVQKGGKTFRWTGKYLENMDDRETLETQLNVLGDFVPKLPEMFRRAQFVFLANGSTKTQLKVLEQTQGASMVVADTMNLWIHHERPELMELLKQIDGLILNDSETKLLTGESNAYVAAKKIMEFGPKFVVVKKGANGAMFVSEYEIYLLPAFPILNVIDPTGAGDSFAGGMMGYIASQGEVNGEIIKRALAYGTIVASFQIEGFGLDKLYEITREDIEKRLEQFRKMINL